MASYLEHMALKVSDLDWHVRFFEEVFEAEIFFLVRDSAEAEISVHAPHESIIADAKIINRNLFIMSFSLLYFNMESRRNFRQRQAVFLRKYRTAGV